jgi:hypothetical protein
MKAIRKLKSGKAVGLDSLPNEIIKNGGTILFPWDGNIFVFTLNANFLPFFFNLNHKTDMNINE